MASSYNLLFQSDEDSLHAARLLNVEEKLYRRLTKRLLTPGSLVSATPQAPPTPPPESSTDEAEAERQAALTKRNEQLQGWQQEANLDFATFDSNVVRAQLLLKSNDRERIRYADEKEKILETAQAVRQTNANLHEQLNAAQRTLEVRKGYDELAEKITSNRALKPREEQLAQIDKLHQEIAELEKESQEYAHTWAERRVQFGKIVEEGMQMLRLIRDEKEEAERKEGMEDIDETAEERETSPSRDERSHVGTPTGGASPLPHPSDAPEKQSPSQGSKLRDNVMALEPLNPPDEQMSETQQHSNPNNGQDSDIEEGQELSDETQRAAAGAPAIELSVASPEPDGHHNNNEQMDVT